MRLSASQACSVADITYRQLDHWARIGFVRPSVEARGPGRRRKYSYRNVVVLRIAKLLLDAGLSFSRVVQTIEVLRQRGPIQRNATLVVSGLNVTVCESDDQVMIAIRGQSGPLALIPLNTVLDAVDQSLTELAS